MIRIRMAYLHDDQFMALQVDHVSLELLCDHQLVRNLSREPGLPSRKESFRGGIPAHHLNRVGRCDDTGVWEAFEPSRRRHLFPHSCWQTQKWTAGPIPASEILRGL